MVGTGSSATQIVPAIQPIVKQLYVFQREPGWIMPKGERDFTDDDRAAFANPWRRRRDRWRQRYLLGTEPVARASLPARAPRPTRRAGSSASTTSSASSPTGPTCARRVTPKYPYPGQAADLREHVLLRAQEGERRAGPARGGVGDADRHRRRRRLGARRRRHRHGHRVPGRRTTWRRLRVVGRGGRTLQEHWAGEPRAYLGITVPGFPNFFMLYGPGTNGGEIVTMLESQAEYAVRAVKRMIRERVTAVEVKPSFEARWYRWLQRTMAGTSWTMSNNYFTSPTGKVVTQWPYGNVHVPRAHQAPGPRVGDDASPTADPTNEGRGTMTHPFSYQGRRVVVTGAARGVGAALLDVLAELDVAHVTAIDLNAPSGPHDAFLADGPLRRGCRARRDRADRRPGARAVQQRGRGRHATARHRALGQLPRAAHAVRGPARPHARGRRHRQHRVDRRQPVAQARRRSTRCSTSTSPTAGPRRCSGSRRTCRRSARSPYNFSKEVVEVYTLRSSRPTMRRGVRTNAVCPGPIDTPLLPEFRADDERQDRRLEHPGDGRAGGQRPARSRRCSRSSARRRRRT